jgi:hypothetical protein
LAIHYSANQESVACGRSGASLEMTQVEAEVSCKLCLRSLGKKAVEPVRKTPSLAELRAAAKAEKAEKAVAPAPVAKPASRVTVAAAAPASQQPVSQSAKSARAEWQQRLAQLPGRNRLPRGASRQSFV